ncbi:CBS domain-containing protein [Thermodesulfobacteriota bacterium]
MMGRTSPNTDVCVPQIFEISDDDILEAMKEIHGYLDITPGDFKVLYGTAYKHAVERLTNLGKARDVMTREVIFVERGTPSDQVANLMAVHGVAGVPVLENGKKVAGVISEKDFLFHMGNRDTRSFMEVVAQCLENKGCVAITMRKQKAEDIMNAPAITVREDTPISEIASIFSEKNINRVPVIDEAGLLLGIVARADIVQASFPQDFKPEEMEG